MKLLTDTHSNERFSLLGAALIATQKVDFLLYRVIQPICKTHLSSEVKPLANKTSDQFLQGTMKELKPVLSTLEETCSEQMPLTASELSDFIYKRNLITHQFWQVTEADIKGSEKIANPEDFLRNLLTECEAWQVKIEAKLG
ncbi:glucosamine-6-phosphate deaminase [Vibrio sp. TBV020]|uniref:glucosamine-6-phosphate deaminase n=1 Tax=Vibrio sp. TBV020 TaxID=3137398 RepID=UPI0038CD4E52